MWKRRAEADRVLFGNSSKVDIKKVLCESEDR